MLNAAERSIFARRHPPRIPVWILKFQLGEIGTFPPRLCDTRVIRALQSILNIGNSPENDHDGDDQTKYASNNPGQT
ncbi:hypothetical protein ACVMB1_000122 [Bradyrhizobium sp. USDA 4504]